MAVLKTSDTGGFVEEHGISVLQLDTGYTGTCFTVHTCNFTFSSVSRARRVAATLKLAGHLP